VDFLGQGSRRSVHGSCGLSCGVIQAGAGPHHGVGGGATRVRPGRSDSGPAAGYRRNPAGTVRAGVSALWQREPLFDEQGLLRARSMIVEW
jgi:hypothetical protein